MDKDKLQEIVKLHKMWIKGKKGGKKANFLRKTCVMLI